MTHKITIVSNYDNWEGVYVDGELKTEGHSVDSEEILKLLGMDVEKIEVSTDYLGGKVAGLPQKLSKIPKKYIIT